MDKVIKTTSDLYATVNDEWPKVVPPLTAQEAASAAKRLYRMAMGKAFRGKVRVTSGNRYCCVRRGEMVVNPDRGWRGMVHDLSHYAFGRRHPDLRPHDSRHAYLERDLVREVVARGWLDGTLRRPEKVKPDPKEVRYKRVLARITAWEKKARRAESALKKLARQKAYYERSGMDSR